MAYMRTKRERAARSRGRHTKAEWLALCQEFDFRCVRCGTGERRVEKDHIVPLYRGGCDCIANLQPLCVSCNIGKGPETINWVIYRRRHGFEDAVA